MGMAVGSEVRVSALLGKGQVGLDRGWEGPGLFLLVHT